jgi:hypothetical protein
MLSLWPRATDAIWSTATARVHHAVTLIGGAAAAWPLTARAQQGERMRRISALTGIADEAGAQARFDAFREALTRLGWIEGQNARIDYRWGEGRPDVIRKHAAGQNEYSAPIGASSVGCALTTAASFLSGRHASVPIYFRSTLEDAAIFGHAADPSPIRTLGGVPVNSLNGVVNTVLWNNVLTAYLTSDLKLVAKLRHYDIDNNTPMLKTTDYNRADSGLVTQDRISLPIAYTKTSVVRPWCLLEA